MTSLASLIARLEADGTWKDLYRGGARADVLWRLRRQGLAIYVGVGVYRASPLGLSVRELLEKEHTNA